jgi:tetratricopeptide (TPR) repeat protein
LTARAKKKDRLVNLEDKVSELEKKREVKDSLNSVLVDSILREKELLADSLNYALSDIKLKSSREKQLLEDSLNATFSDTIDKISREKQLLADSLTQYQVEFAHSLNKAKQAYNDSIQENRASQAIDKHYNEGKRQFDNKNYDLAIKSFNQALNIDNTDILSHYYRGWASYYMGLNHDALVDAEYCVKNGGNNAYSLKGWAQYKLGNHKEAFSNFNDCIRLNKTDSKCYNGKGNYYFMIKMNYQLALDAFSKAIKYNSKEGKYYFNRGLANERLRYKGDACADYRKAVRLGFTQAQSQLNAYCK